MSAEAAARRYQRPPEYKVVETQVLAEMQRIVDGFPLSLLQTENVDAMFREGGPFEGINEDLALIVFFFFVCLVVDFGFVKHVIQPKARYFALHAVINFIVVWYALPEVIEVVLGDPAMTFFGKMKTMIPNSAVCSMHVYHCVIWWYELTSEDIFHHVYFAFALCGLAIPVKNISGCASNFGAFNFSGFPGMCDYIWLVMQYHGWISRETEKKWNMYINLYFRAPFGAVYCFIAYTAYFNPGIERQEPPSVIFRISAFLGPALFWVNAHRYGRMAVESHHVYCLKDEDGTLEKEAAERKKKAAAAAAAAAGEDEKEDHHNHHHDNKQHHHNKHHSKHHSSHHHP